VKSLVYLFKRTIKRRNFITRVLSIGLYIINIPQKIKYPSRIKNIIVIHNNYLGDTVFFSPVYRNLRLFFPEARIVSLCESGYSRLLSADENIDEVITYPDFFKKEPSSRMAAFREKLNFLIELRKERFQVIIDLYGSGFAIALGFFHLFKAYRIEIFLPALLDTIKSYILILKGYTAREYKRPHAVLWNLQRLESLGIEITTNDVSLPVKSEWIESLHKKYPEIGALAGEYFIICPGATWLERQWSVDKFAAVAENLSKATGLCPIICGGKSEYELCQRVSQSISVKSISLAGAISMVEFVALVSGARLLVGNDSGPVHVATGVKTPVVAIMGTANIEMYKPWGKDVRICYREVTCGPCYAGKCYMPENICVQPVTVDEVLTAALDLLKIPKSVGQ